jgi:hypothetical protein
MEEQSIVKPNPESVSQPGRTKTNQENPSPEAKKQSKLFLIIIIFLLFGVFLVFGYQYYRSLWRPSMAPTKDSTLPTGSNYSPIPSPAPTSDWQIYNNTEVGFTFKYPIDVALYTEGELDRNNQTVLSVLIDNINLLEEELPFNQGKKAAQEDRDLLQKGEYGLSLGMSVEESKEVKKLDGINSKRSLSLTGLDVCTINFIRSLVFYKDNYRVIITYSGPKNLFISDNPNYFLLENKECSSLPMWNFNNNSPELFYTDLINGNTSKSVNAWYSTFDQIISTFKFTDQNDEINKAEEALIQYFSLLSEKKYLQAVDYHGSGFEYLQNFCPGYNEEQKSELLECACNNTLKCLKIFKIIEGKKIGSSKYSFLVHFRNEDGSLFERGPCCGATEEEMPIQSEFEYTVEKAGDSFLVITQPIYIP